jgi:hypothetical protein
MTKKKLDSKCNGKLKRRWMPRLSQSLDNSPVMEAFSLDKSTSTSGCGLTQLEKSPSFQEAPSGKWEMPTPGTSSMLPTI